MLDAADDADLIVLRAPGGAGKTTLLSEWVARRPAGEDIVWISLDERAGTRSGFWHIVLDGLGRIGLLSDGGTLARDAAGFLSPEFAAAEIAADLNRLGTPVRIVLDDLHRADATAEQDVQRLAVLLHDAKLIVATRTVGALESPVLAARRRVAVVTAEALALTAEETRALSIALRSEVTAHEARSLCAAAGGHALLTRLALSGGPTRGGGPTRRVAEIAAQELVPMLTADELEFAMLVAQSPVVDASLASAITQRDDAAQRLDAFARDGLGAIGADDFFVFHDLMRSVLLRQSERSLTPEQRARAKSVAATALRQRPRHELSTLHLLAESGRTSEMWSHFALNFSLFIGHIPAAVEAILRELPPAVIAGDGTLGAMLAIIQSEREATPSSGLLNTVDTALVELGGRGEAPDLVTALLREAAVMGLLRAARRYAQAERAGMRFFSVAETLDSVTRAFVAPGIYAVAVQLAITHVLTGDLESALQVLAESASDPLPGRQQHRRALAAYIHAVRGDLPMARSTLDTVESTDVAFRLTAISSTGWHIARSIDALERGEVEQARNDIRAIERRLDLIEHWPYALWALARTHLMSDPFAGIEDLDRLLVVHGDRPASPRARALLDAAVADLAIAVGDLSRARSLTEHRGEHDTALQLTAARLALAADDPTAIPSLRALLDRPGLWPRHRAEGLLLLAVHEIRAGHAGSARDAFRRAKAILKECGLSTPPTTIPREDLDALVALEGGEVVEPGPDPFGRSLHALTLTARERELLERLIGGKAMRRIAAESFVSANTIKSQAAGLYRKLGVTSRTEAVDEARRRGLLR
jgi:LuxR family maltose regulon positive regulatory protein